MVIHQLAHTYFETRQIGRLRHQQRFHRLRERLSRARIPRASRDAGISPQPLAASPRTPAPLLGAAGGPGRAKPGSNASRREIPVSAVLRQSCAIG
jgi:hypothetical protein